MLSRLFDYIAKSPLIKTLVFGISTIVSSILAGLFVYEITMNGIVEWETFYKAKSFIGILIWLLFVCLYNSFLYEREMDILKFKDENYCKAYIRSQCLPEVAARYRNLVRSGNTSDLKDIAGEIKRMIK